ncbi:hypothetical protein [Bowmanella denitrificans]|uniref:hypothetical protein n=1 Tax=Bowmanella denitrificans TaxID=366582 RepID=UPI001558C043|nr:hypothetical protein [Bowmanella denitrificans]
MSRVEGFVFLDVLVIVVGWITKYILYFALRAIADGAMFKFFPEKFVEPAGSHPTRPI